MSRSAELGRAWADAEAALPEGWELELTRFGAGDYTATAAVQPTEQRSAYLSLDGPTPAAALEALAAALRARSAPSRSTELGR